MAVANYRELVVWQKAIDFVVNCYRASGRFPKSETYALCSQLQRSAVSVPANIAEGQGRFHTKEFINFLSVANGSRCETETHLIIAQRLGYLPDEEADRLLSSSAEIGRMLHGLVKALERSQLS